MPHSQPIEINKKKPKAAFKINYQLITTLSQPNQAEKNRTHRESERLELNPVNWFADHEGIGTEIKSALPINDVLVHWFKAARFKW